MEKITLWALLLTGVLMLSACGIPVPPEKSQYVGEWRGQAMTLNIAQDGSVSYKRTRSGATTTIEGPIRRFEGDNFVVGIPLLSDTFQVSKPPYQDKGRWKMTVDGVDLTRAR